LSNVTPLGYPNYHPNTISNIHAIFCPFIGTSNGSAQSTTDRSAQCAAISSTIIATNFPAHYSTNGTTI
jgi:hypothetical protein